MCRSLMAERGLSVDHSTVWRWVQRYAPILNQRIRREVRHPNRSWRIDETYIRMAGRWVYLYRAVDSCGETIEFMLSPKRDLVAAKHFLQLALCRAGPVRPRVINVDGHPAYATAISELKQSGEIGKQCRCRSVVLFWRRGSGGSPADWRRHVAIKSLQPTKKSRVVNSRNAASARTAECADRPPM